MSDLAELKSTKESSEKSFNSTVNSELDLEREKSAKPLTKPKKRCSTCRKKLGLTGKLIQKTLVILIIVCAWIKITSK